MAGDGTVGQVYTHADTQAHTISCSLMYVVIDMDLVAGKTTYIPL